MEIPRFPESDELLINSLRAHPRLWKDLDEYEKQVLRDAKPVPCPVCGKLYSFYDPDQRRLKYHCSLKCSNASRAVYDIRCPLCPKLCKSLLGLERHRAKKHRDVSVGDYLDAYLVAKGILPQKHCPGCGKKLHPSITYGDYTTCKCVNSERKIEETRKLIESTNDPAEKKHLQKSLGGLNSVAKRLRGIKNINKVMAVDRKTKSQMEVRDLLREDAELFNGLLTAMSPIYRAYEDLLNADERRLKDKNSELRDLSQHYRWEPSERQSNGCFLYVLTFDPEFIDSSERRAQIFTYPIPYTVSQYNITMKAVSLGSKIDELMKDVPSPVRWMGRMEHQCWHRFCIIGGRKNRYVPTPLVALKVREMLKA